VEKALVTGPGAHIHHTNPKLPGAVLRVKVELLILKARKVVLIEGWKTVIWVLANVALSFQQPVNLGSSTSLRRFPAVMEKSFAPEPATLMPVRASRAVGSNNARQDWSQAP